MSGTAAPTLPRRAQRHEATRAEIVAAAWELVREQGLAGLTMRDLGRRVGMTAQSLYSYVAAKHDIYDAMFAEGYRAFGEWMSAVTAPGPDEHDDPVALARTVARRYLEFCTDDPVRFQLLFQRTIPGFEPSPDSYALAVESLQRLADQLTAIGVTAPQALDLWTAVLTGLASQQVANDPRGDRWTRLGDDAVDMLLAHTRPPRSTRRPR